LVMLHNGVARQESLLAKDPTHVLLHSHLAGSYTMLADSLLDSAQKKSAIEYYKKAVSARLAFAEKSPNSMANRRALADCYSNLAKALAPDDREEALKQYDNAVELLENLASSDRSNARYRIALADVLSNTAGVYVSMAGREREPSARFQDWTMARSLYQRSSDMWQELDKSGKLPPGRSRVIPEVAAEVARCDESIAKLRPAH